MKAIRNLATLAAVAMMFATFGASRASAQSAARGTFKLPIQTRWGTANLPPGSYHFEISGPEGIGNVLRTVMVWRRTEGARPVFILGQIDGGASPTEANALLCQRRGPVCVVHTLQLGFAGETLIFTAPKGERIEREVRGRKNHAQKRQSAAAIETVPIVFSGK